MSKLIVYLLLLNILLVFCVNFCLCVKDTISSTEQERDTLTRKCYGKFGCYSIEDPWEAIHRPIAFFPFPPEVINPEYCLYTENNDVTCEQLLLDEPQSIFKTSYVPGGKVYFITHGFGENGHQPWIMRMVRELLKMSGSSNVIVINWSAGSQPPYTQAVANIRLVGVMTAHLIKMIRDQGVGLETERTHFIGHSLGAHLGGYVGTTLTRNFNLRLGRITGMDPAEPHFEKTAPIVRLDPTDAIFVDVIHTDASPITGFGMNDPLGHVDFYPNGGKNQPGCGKLLHIEGKISFFNLMKDRVGCNHIRSHFLFTESINSPDKFLAVECPSWELYLRGSCFKCDYNPVYKNGTQCARLGFHSIKSFYKTTSLPRYRTNNNFKLIESPKRRFVSMYLITGDSAPFHQSQYRVSWKMSNFSRESGKFVLKIIGNDGTTTSVNLGNENQFFEAGSEHTVVVGGGSVGNLKSAVLNWTQETHIYNPLTWRLYYTPISINYIQIDSLDTGERLVLCEPENITLRVGKPQALNMCLV